LILVNKTNARLYFRDEFKIFFINDDKTN
jgi:hypothetical protein